MGRNASRIVLNAAERRQLERLSRSRAAPLREIERARIVLLAAEGLTNSNIARQLGMCRPSVALWRNRFVKAGMNGFKERPRPGRPPTYTETARARVVDTASMPPPAPSSRWTVRNLATQTAVGRETVRRILRRETANLGDLEEKSAILARSFVFSDLGREHLEELSRVGLKRQFTAGQFLYFSGDILEYCHVVGSGMVKMVKHSPSGKDFTIGISGAGEIFGSSLVLAGEPCSSSCQAVLDTVVVAISGKELLTFLGRHPNLSLSILIKILNVALKNLQHTSTRLSELVSERADYRLANALLTLSLEFGAAIPLTRREIAQIAGTTAETATRFISKLSQRGVVKALRGRVIIIQRNKLGLLVGGLSPI